MATFVRGQSITTTVPQITVDAGLRVGRHRFSLVVVDNTGTPSQPDVVTVEVQQSPTPLNPRSRAPAAARKPRSKR